MKQNLNLLKVIEEHKNFDLHQKNIRHIENRRTLYDAKRKTIISCYKKQRESSQGFAKKNREEEVAKENEFILQKINRIYNRDLYNPTTRSTDLSRKNPFPTLRHSSEIEDQNVKMAGRIMRSKSTLNTGKQLRERYTDILKYKERLSHFQKTAQKPVEKYHQLAEKLIAHEDEKTKRVRTKSAERTTR